MFFKNWSKWNPSTWVMTQLVFGKRQFVHPHKFNGTNFSNIFVLIKDIVQVCIYKKIKWLAEFLNHRNLK